MLALEQTILTVSELNARARECIEQTFQIIGVIGEISNLARPRSGHLYFSLKDKDAQIRCAFFKPLNNTISDELADGQQVIVLARVSLYEARGDYQLIVQRLELAGDGRLQQAFELRKRKLDQEGLFAIEHKKPCPLLPSRIGIITSATSAAVHDAIRVLQRRFPAMPIIIYPCLVQGDQAAASITRSIIIANQRQECDVILLTRGGGSLEDLWPFNEECVARAIFDSTLPIITGIGHEVDTTLADLVADQRAATPSAAAEIATPQQDDLTQQVFRLKQRLQQYIGQQLRQYVDTVNHLSRRLVDPQERLQQHMQRLDDIQRRLHLSMKTQLTSKQHIIIKMKALLQGKKTIAANPTAHNEHKKS